MYFECLKQDLYYVNHLRWIGSIIKWLHTVNMAFPCYIYGLLRVESWRVEQNFKGKQLNFKLYGLYYYNIK